MSLSKKDRKIQPVSGKDFPNCPAGMANSSFAQVIADALRRDFGGTHAAVKSVVNLIGANERAVKNWFLAKNGPSGKHLVDLARTSDEVLEAVLIMSGRCELVVAKKLADSKQVLIEMLRLIGELQGQPTPDPRDVIYAAFYSAFVKYPKEDDPALSNHWIEPVHSAHLTRVVMLALEANGFQIVKKSG
jgi:hypothetical protein